MSGAPKIIKDRHSKVIKKTVHGYTAYIPYETLRLKGTEKLLRREFTSKTRAMEYGQRVAERYSKKFHIHMNQLAKVPSSAAAVSQGQASTHANMDVLRRGMPIPPPKEGTKRWGPKEKDPEPSAEVID